MTNGTKIAAGLRITLVDDEYWIGPHDPPIGPYERKREAQEDLEGIRRFYNDLPASPIDLALKEII